MSRLACLSPTIPSIRRRHPSPSSPILLSVMLSRSNKTRTQHPEAGPSTSNRIRHIPTDSQPSVVGPEYNYQHTRGRTRPPRASIPNPSSHNQSSVMPLLQRGSRSMGSVPTVRSIMCMSDGEEETSSTGFVGIVGSPLSRSRKASRIFSVMRRSSSQNQQRGPGDAQVSLATCSV